MQEVLLVVQVLIAVALVCVVLLQKTAQDGGGLMGGSGTMGGLFTARGSANLITRTTAILATLFILNSLALSYIASRAHHDLNLVDKVAAELPGQGTAPAAPAADKLTDAPPAEPAAPAVPVAK